MDTFRSSCRSITQHEVESRTPKPASFLIELFVIKKWFESFLYHRTPRNPCPAARTGVPKKTRWIPDTTSRIQFATAYLLNYHALLTFTIPLLLSFLPNLDAVSRGSNLRGPRGLDRGVMKVLCYLCKKSSLFLKTQNDQ